VAPLPPWDCKGPWVPEDGGFAAAEGYAALGLDEGSIDEFLGSRVEIPQWRKEGEALLTSMTFQTCMALIIVANAALIGLETDKGDLPICDLMERIFLAIFATELVLKLVIYKPKVFFDSGNSDLPWNLFDFFIVSLGVTDFTMALLGDAATPGSFATVFRIFRMLRILRIFRIFKVLKELYKLAFGFALAAIATFWVAFLMVFALYTCAIVLVRTVGQPGINELEVVEYSLGQEDALLHQKFRLVGRAMLTLFGMVASPTLEEWEGVMAHKPGMAAFIVVFVVFGSFGMIALLTGVISESMFDKNNLKLEEDRVSRERTRKLLIRTCESLFDELPQDASMETGARSSEVSAMMPQIATLFEATGVSYAHEDLNRIIELLERPSDSIGGKTILRDDFKFVLIQMAEGVRPLLIMRLLYAMSTVQRLVASSRASLSQLELRSIGLSRQASMQSTAASSTHRMAWPKGITRSMSIDEDMLGVQNTAQDVYGLEGMFEQMHGSVEYVSEQLDRLTTEISDAASQLDHTSGEVQGIQKELFPDGQGLKHGSDSDGRAATPGRGKFLLKPPQGWRSAPPSSS